MEAHDLPASDYSTLDNLFARKTQKIETEYCEQLKVAQIELPLKDYFFWGKDMQGKVVGKPSSRLSAWLKDLLLLAWEESKKEYLESKNFDK